VFPRRLAATKESEMSGDAAKAKEAIDDFSDHLTGND
jgi:hypothetical protein